MRVLVIEDEARLLQNLRRAYRDACGYAVDTATDGREAVFLAKSAEYDLVVLDLMLPGLDGLSVLRQIRKAERKAPVLVLTARDEKPIIIEVLNAGADDFLAKPFDLGELFARSKALMRRTKGLASSILRIGDLEINTAERSIKRGPREIELTPMEYRVLEYLAYRPRAVVSKSELLEHLYDFNWEKFSNVLEVYISGLRRKLDNQAAPLIHTVRGHGYVLRE
jgi:two-component system response regulator PhoP